MKRMNLKVLLGVLVLCSVMLLVSHAAKAEPVIGWGLSFQTEGQLPAGPATPDALRALDAAYLDPDGGRVLYLTFDAGYENGYTADILDILKRHKVPAAFFLAGDYLERNADLVRRMTDEGHIVGNHTMNHPDMTKLDAAAFERELREVETLYEEITGQTLPKFYRPPQGLYSEQDLKRAQSLGYKTVFWSLAHADWDNSAQPDPAASMEKLTARLHDGAVVLLHSTSQTNARILDALITRWQELGYRFAPLTELFQ